MNYIKISNEDLERLKEKAIKREKEDAKIYFIMLPFFIIVNILALCNLLGLRFVLTIVAPLLLFDIYVVNTKIKEIKKIKNYENLEVEFHKGRLVVNERIINNKKVIYHYSYFIYGNKKKERVYTIPEEELKIANNNYDVVFAKEIKSFTLFETLKTKGPIYSKEKEELNTTKTQESIPDIVYIQKEMPELLENNGKEIELPEKFKKDLIKIRTKNETHNVILSILLFFGAIIFIAATIYFNINIRIEFMLCTIFIPILIFGTSVNTLHTLKNKPIKAFLYNGKPQIYENHNQDGSVTYEYSVTYIKNETECHFDISKERYESLKNNYDIIYIDELNIYKFKNEIFTEG